jgi:hypothetical protein
MDSRGRILTALNGDERDRVPRALALYGQGFEALAPPGQWRDAWVDVAFVDLALSPEERELERSAPLQIEGGDWAIPTNEHFLPWHYVLAMQDKVEPIRFFAERLTLGAISMRSLWIG